jgi:methionine sulfoxide reductase heme-binding subunit
VPNWHKVISLLYCFGGKSAVKEKFEGPNLAIVLASIVALWSLFFLVIGGFSEKSVNQMLTITIRLAFLYFIIAFSASSINFIHKSTLSRWLLRNRRYIGIAFGLAFVMHFLGIGLKAWMYPDPFVEGLHFRRVVRGGIMLGVVLLLTLTSSDYVVRRVRPWLWKAIHIIGGFYIFYRFWLNYSSFAKYDSIYYIAVGMLVLAAALKVIKYVGGQFMFVRRYMLAGRLG